MEKRKYAYAGPVLSFGKIISNKWYAETIAVSEKKARNNLTFRCKKELGLLPGTRIELPGTIKEME